MSVYLRRFLYAILGLLALVLVLVIGVVVFLQFPAGQDFVARRAESYLRGKLNTEVRLGTFRTDFRHAINFDNVYLADQQRDTLVSVGHLGVSIDVFALLRSKINVSDVELENGRVRLTRTEPDSVNNYDFIIKAFSDPTAPVDTTASSLTYDIGKLHVSNLLFTQNDQVAGSDLRARIGDLLVNMDEVDVTNSIYKIDKVALRHSAVRMAQTKTAPELDDNKPTEPLDLTFGLNQATIEDFGFEYKNDPAAQYIRTQVGLADVTAKNIDLAKERIDLTKLTLKNTTFAYAQNKDVPVAERVINPAEAVRKVNDAAQQAAPSPLAWRVTLGQSDISQLAVNFDNFNDPKVKSKYPALDYSHLHFTDLVLNTRDLDFTENLTTVKIDNLAGRDQSGFAITSARANAVYDSTDIKLDSLDLITPHSRIKRSLAIHYKSLGEIADDLPNLGLAGDLRETRLGFRDLLYLVPDLADTPPFTTGPDQSVLLTGLVSGRLGDLAIRGFEFVGLRNTVIAASRAHIVGLPEVDGRLFVDIDIQKFNSSRADLLSILPKGTLPDNISLPPTLSLSGTFRGRPTTLAFDTNLKLRSTYGNVAFNGQLGAARANGQQPLVGTFAVQNFDAGKLLKDPSIGTITGAGRINAVGNLQDPNTLVGKLTANIQSARYNGYAYRGITAAVDIDRGKYTIAASSKSDPNLDLDLNAVVNLRDANNPTYQVTSLNLRGANLTKLGFYTGGDLRVQGDLTANISGSGLNTINGTFSGSQLVVIKDGLPIALDSVRGRIVQTATRTAVMFTSNVADLKLDGNVHLGDLATELQRHISRYFRLPGVQPFTSTAGNQQFTYSLQVKNTLVLTKLVKDLKKISPFTLAGDYSRAQARLTAQTSIGLIRYQNYRLDSLRLDVGSDPRKLAYDLRLARARQDSSLNLRQPSVVGSVANNKVNVRAAILGDSSNREKLALAGALTIVEQRRGDAYQFAFADNQIINYNTWTAGTGNYVRYNADGSVTADNVRLANGQAALVIQSQNPAVNTSPLAVRFEQFDLGIGGKAIGLADSTLGGTLNGEALVRGLGTQRLGFTADLTIKDVLYSKTVLGDLALQASNPEPDRYDVTARLSGGGGNDVTVQGAYRTVGTTPLDFTVDVRRLNLKTAEPFSAGQLSQGVGYLSGQLTLAGTTSAPQVRGTLTTSADAGFVVPQLGSPFRLVSQPVTFDEKGIAFKNFTVRDSIGNKAVANGYLLTPNLLDYAFDLRVTTDNFLAVKSKRTKDNTLYYGRLVVDSDTRLTGPLTLIKIDTKATVVKGSDLTVENPAVDPSVVAREGIVQFVDFSLPASVRARKAAAADSANTDAIGYDITARITITDETPFTFVVDPVSGDNLRIRAAGTLTTTLDASGNLTLTGRLDVARGKYKLSLYGITKEFIIAQGSSVTWSGDPYNADLNITAIYKVKAAPGDLLAGQGSGNQDVQTQARNLMTFNVLLKVTDQLSKPTIGFDITLPEDQRSGALGGEVDARLAQLRQPGNTSDLSKQVFSLLVLERFIQQNPFATTAGESIVASQLRGSVSQVLTDQLQNLTGQYLAGLGLDLGISNQADYTSNSAAGRTDLNVAVRRQLFNDRLTVRLGTDVPLSGGNGNQTTQGKSAASSFAGDISLEYTLLADGRLRLRAFRQNAYEDIDGAIVRTGASLVYQREYNNLKELFEKISPEVKAERRRNRKQDKLYEAEQKRRDQRLADSTAAANGAVRLDTTKRIKNPK